MKVELYNLPIQEFVSNQTTLKPECIYTDPPWNNGVAKNFANLASTQTGTTINNNYHTIIDTLFQLIQESNCETIFIEHAYKDTYIFDKYNSLLSQNYFHTYIESVYGSKNTPLKVLCISKDVNKLPQQKEWMTCQKGQSFCARMIKEYLSGYNTLLDPFCGSGMSGVGALRCGMNFIGNELQPNRLEKAKVNISKFKVDYV